MTDDFDDDMEELESEQHFMAFQFPDSMSEEAIEAVLDEFTMKMFECGGEVVQQGVLIGMTEVFEFEDDDPEE